MFSERDTEKEKKAFKIKYIYQAFGISKQAYYQRLERDRQQALTKEKVIKMILDYRKKLPQTGTRKLYFILSKQFKEEGIKMGRDKFNDLLPF